MSAASKSKSIDQHKLDEIFGILDKLTGDELHKKYAEFAKQYPGIMLGGKPADEVDPEDEEKPIPAMEVPHEGRVKDWGATQDPSSWKVEKTKDTKWGQFKVTDGKNNVADGFGTEDSAKYFIEYYQKTKTVPTDNEGTKPNVPDPDPSTNDDNEKPTPSTGFPIPTGYKPIGGISTKFDWWGRHETNYKSGGKGPSERWDNDELGKALNALSGYEFNLGTRHGKRGSDNIDLKFRSNHHNSKSGGWLIPFIDWEEDGSDGSAGVGKEYPHSTTSHLDFNVQGKGVKVKNIKDGNWHGFLGACFNDKNGVPTVYLWYAENPTGKFSDYRLLGISKDTGMKPGPVADKIDIKGGKPQSLQIRMDEVPDAKIRNAFAVEIQAPE